MTRTLAIDPGNTESGWCLIDDATRAPYQFGKDPNHDVIEVLLTQYYDNLAVEMVASYGMAVGKEVFETCVWIGRFLQAAGAPFAGTTVYRREVKLHHCHSAKAKDSNIRQALVDRFASGRPNHGKGTKAHPGWFYAFKSDIWQAYALAVYIADLRDGVSP